MLHFHFIGIAQYFCVYLCVCNKACHNLYIRNVFVINESYMFAMFRNMLRLITHTHTHTHTQNSIGTFKFVICFSVNPEQKNSGPKIFS